LLAQTSATQKSGNDHNKTGFYQNGYDDQTNVYDYHQNGYYQ